MGWNRDRGFTVLEAIVVVVCVIIMAAIALFVVRAR